MTDLDATQAALAAMKSRRLRLVDMQDQEVDVIAWAALYEDTEQRFIRRAPLPNDEELTCIWIGLLDPFQHPWSIGLWRSGAFVGELAGVDDRPTAEALFEQYLKELRDV